MYKVQATTYHVGQERTVQYYIRDESVY